MFTLALNSSVRPLMLCNFSSSETAEYDMRDDFACNIDIFPCVYIGVNERVSGILPAAEFAQAGAVCRERVLSCTAAPRESASAGSLSCVTAWRHHCWVSLFVWYLLWIHTCL